MWHNFTHALWELTPLISGAAGIGLAVYVSLHCDEEAS